MRNPSDHFLRCINSDFDKVNATLKGSMKLRLKFGGKIIDTVSGDINTPQQKANAIKAENTIVKIVLIVLVGSLCMALRAWLFTSASERVVERLKNNLFSHIFNQEIAF